MRIALVVVIGAVLVAGGGPILAETKSTYVPPFAYLNYDCPQLVREARALSTRSATLVGVRQSDRTADAARPIVRSSLGPGHSPSSVMRTSQIS